MKLKSSALVVILGLGVLVTPLAADAQQPANVPRVALIFTTSPVSEMIGPDPIHPNARAFVHAFRDLGYVEGRNIVIERRSAEGKFERLGEIIAELLRSNVSVIVTTGDAMTQRAKELTAAVPIVMGASWRPASSRAWRVPVATSRA